MRPLRIIAIAGGTLLFLLLGVYAYFEIQFSSLKRRISSEQAWILYHVDHKVLARETRNFAKQRLAQHGRGLVGDVLKSDDPHVPAPLAVLKPRSIAILDGYVRLEFGGALLHFGIIVYDEGLEGPGTKKLGEGVWFYSENGRYPGFWGEKRKGPPSGG
jgi:hypothetical protein